MEKDHWLGMCLSPRQKQHLLTLSGSVSKSPQTGRHLQPEGLDITISNGWHKPLKPCWARGLYRASPCGFLSFLSPCEYVNNQMKVFSLEKTKDFLRSSNNTLKWVRWSVPGHITGKSNLKRKSCSSPWGHCQLCRVSSPPEPELKKGDTSLCKTVASWCSPHTCLRERCFATGI